MPRKGISTSAGFSNACAVPHDRTREAMRRRLLALMGSWQHEHTANRPRAKSLAPLRALLPFIRPYRAMMAAALSALLVATVAMLALPVALRRSSTGWPPRTPAPPTDIHRISGGARSFRGVRRLAFLSGHLGRRTGGCRFAHRRVSARRSAWIPLFYETTRVGEVLSRLTTDTTLVQAISGVNLSIILRSTLKPDRRAGHAGAHQREADGRDPGADSRWWSRRSS